MVGKAVFFSLLLLLSALTASAVEAPPPPFGPATSANSAPRPHLVLNSPFSAPLTSPAQDGFLDLLYAELFRRLDLSFEIQLMPGERALWNANAGLDDGDVCRIAGLEADYPNLRRSQEAVLDFQMVVFSRGPDFVVAGAASLLPYELGILRGWKILEDATSLHPRRVELDQAEQLFRMLDHDRLELALIDRFLGQEIIERLEIQGVKMLAPPLLSGNWYLYLHESHQQLLPEIDRELRRMKEDGSYERLRRQALGAFEEFNPEEHMP